MNTLSNIKNMRSYSIHHHKLRTSSSSKLYIIYATQKRNFAEGDGITRPSDGKYKNVFNKRKSRCGRFTYYSTFPYDYNEPWPFPPVYNKHGGDLNQDPVWGQYGQATSSSITGKPKRALGHYPWIGRPIVPVKYIFNI